MATVFTIMSYGGMALAVICLILAVVLFVKWNIPKVLGDLTGHTEKKTIERIREEGYEVSTSKKSFMKTAEDTGRIKIRKTNTDTLADENSEKKKNIVQESAVTKEENVTTTVLNVYNPEEETMVLAQAQSEEDTTVLSGMSMEKETTVLGSSSTEEETTVLGDKSAEEETTVLNTQTENIHGGEDMHPSEEATTILAENRVEGVINIPNETFTQMGTVAKVLDFIVTHTDDVVT